MSKVRATIGATECAAPPAPPPPAPPVSNLMFYLEIFGAVAFVSALGLVGYSELLI